MLEIVRTRAAEHDLLEIWKYIAEHSPDAADRHDRQLEGRINLLAESPLLGTACPELAPDLRCFTSGNYALFYRIDDQARVLILVRVLHAARDFPSLFGIE